MKSRTKYRVDNAVIKKLTDSAGIQGATEIAPLGAGEYNAVYSVKACGREYVIKIAPKDDIPVLTYENNIMASEVFWYKTINEHSTITVPEIYHTDFGGSIIPASYIIMEKLSGQQLDNMDFTEAEGDVSVSEMAMMAAQIHKIGNDKFGYVQNELFDDWYEAIRAMTGSLINDCKRKRRNSKRGKKLLKFIDKYKAVLKQAECSMVNFDLWPSNIICRREGGRIKYAWIDPERSFWGDRICDFVCLEMSASLADKKKSLAAYNSVSDKPVVAGEYETIRYAVAQGYLALILETEKYYRYTPFHFGWWRNVFASAMLFNKAFQVLNNG